MTEEQRGLIIKDTKDHVDFTYNGWNPEPIIARYYEGHDWKHPQILFQFSPTNRTKFMSISNFIGKMSNRRFNKFGYCQMEVCTIKCYAGKQHNDYSINGRLLAEHMANTELAHVMKYWDYVLFQFNATWDDFEPPVVKDATIYLGRKATPVYIYEFDVSIRTQLRWNDEIEGEDEYLVEKIAGIDYKNKLINDYNINFTNKALE